MSGPHKRASFWRVSWSSGSQFPWVKYWRKKTDKFKTTYYQNDNFFLQESLSRTLMPKEIDGSKKKTVCLNYFSYLLICMLIQLYLGGPVPGSKSRMIPQKHIWNSAWTSSESPQSKLWIFSNMTFNFVELFFLQCPTQGNCGLGSDFILMSVLSTFYILPSLEELGIRGQPSGQTAGGNLSLF